MFGKLCTECAVLFTSISKHAKMPHMTNRLTKILWAGTLLLCGCTVAPFSLPTAASSASASAAVSPSVQAETDTSGFYYDQLNQNAQSLYTQLLAAADSGQHSVTFDQPASQSDFLCAMTAFSRDHPEVPGTSSWSWTGYQGGSLITQVSWQAGGDASDQMLQVQQAASQVISSNPDPDDPVSTMQYFYEWIIQNTDYGRSTYDQDIRSVFLDHVSVCNGYARAFKYLCDMAGIPCVVVEGTANNERHAWNLVTINGSTYWVDVTWGDPLYQEDDSGQALTYRYFCVPDELMLRTHTIDDGAGDPDSDNYVSDVFQYPSCTDWSLDYYVRDGSYFTSYDRMSVYQYFMNRFTAGQYDLALQFSLDVCQQAFDDLFSGDVPYMQTIMAGWFSGRVSCRYSTDPDTGVLEISFSQDGAQ